MGRKVRPGESDEERGKRTCVVRIQVRERILLYGGSGMVARLCLLLALASVVLSCRSAPVAATPEGPFGPVRILLYAELREGTHGWMGASPVARDMEAVDYSYSGNFNALDAAMAEIIRANEDGTRHKAVVAIVTGKRIHEFGEAAVRIHSSKDIQIVDLPAVFFDVWKATMRVPPLK
jgi:hypothetical protein